MADIELTALDKSFGTTKAVNGLSMRVRSGAFLSLLGPSGCGKTTVLRLIAGLERPDAGCIAIGRRVVADERDFVDAEDRGLGMVFQSYALWPHMSVRANVEFGLEVQRLPKAERRVRVGEALEMVGLSAYADRRPHELSGGQRQRVALARSLAVRPPLILLDEPLANLDAHLRETMQAEFRRIHRQSGTTFVFVTHDQSEAMALADLVAIMDHGRLQQLSSPAALYGEPASPMVARFIGHGRTIPVEILPGADGVRGHHAISLRGRVFHARGCAPAGPGWLCVRTRDLRVVPLTEASGAAFVGRVVDQRFEDGGYLVSLALGDGGDAVAQVFADRPAEIGAELSIALDGGWVIPREDACGA